MSIDASIAMERFTRARALARAVAWLAASFATVASPGFAQQRSPLQPTSPALAQAQPSSPSRSNSLAGTQPQPQATPPAAVTSAAPATIAPPAVVDPASVVPGSKAVARRITLVVEDLERSLRFYTALGFKADRRVEVTDSESLEVFGLPAGSRLTFVRLVSDNTLSTGRIDGGTLGLAQVHEPRLERLRDRTGGVTLLGMPILVMTTDGVDAIHARLRALGAEILKPPHAAPGGLRSMILRDPDGTRMEVTQPSAAAFLPAAPSATSK